MNGHKFDLTKFPYMVATGTHVLINKRGHTFDGYTGIVHSYHALNGKIKRYEIRLDDGQDLKGGNGFTLVTPKSLIKLTWGKK
jgi:hypothetical protein